MAGKRGIGTTTAEICLTISIKLNMHITGDSKIDHEKENSHYEELPLRKMQYDAEVKPSSEVAFLALNPGASSQSACDSDKLLSVLQKLG